MKVKKYNRKAIMLAAVVGALAVLNINKYFGPGSAVEKTPASRKSVGQVEFPAALDKPRKYVFARDVFSRVEIEVAQPEPVEPAPELEVPVPEQQPEVIDVRAHPDIQVVGIANRAGRAMALMKLEGKTYFVSAGDSFGGRYTVNKIEESNVYVFMQ